MSGGHFIITRAIHGKQPWHAVWQSANGKKVWQTEMLSRKRAALAACGNFAVDMVHPDLYDRWGMDDDAIWFTRDEPIDAGDHVMHTWRVPIKHVDERDAVR